MQQTGHDVIKSTVIADSEVCNRWWNLIGNSDVNGGRAERRRPARCISRGPDLRARSSPSLGDRVPPAGPQVETSCPMLL